MREPYFSGYYEDKYGSGIKSVDIYAPEEEGGYVAVWADDNLADDVDSKDYFARNYGDKFFKTLEDYKADNTLSIEDVWPK